MVIFIIITIVFLILMFLPFCFARFVNFDKHNGISVFVRADNVKDPRYFAKSFIKIINKAIDNYDGSGTMQLSKSEKIVFAGKLAPSVKLFNELIISNDTFKTNENITFTKEIFCKKDLRISAGCLIRGAASNNNLFIEENCEIIRWVDAPNIVAIKRGNHGSHSITSGGKLFIDNECDFHRLYAEKGIVVGPFKDSVFTENFTEVTVMTQFEKYHEIFRNTKKLERKSVIKGNIITEYKLEIGCESIIYGDIKGAKSILIKKNSIIVGNLFADGDILLESGVQILESVFTQENLYIASNVVIGCMDRIKSVISRKSIYLCEGCTIYGYVGSENISLTVSKKEFRKLVNKKLNICLDKTVDKEIMLNVSFVPIILTNKVEKNIFPTLEVFNAIDAYGFRNNLNITCITIPEGATVIGSSMFYGCKNIEQITIPHTVKKICGHAFSGCESLCRINLSSDSKLIEIDDFAFSFCKSLQEFFVPKNVSRIGSAAFRNCVSLKKINFDSPENIKEIGSHAFQNCLELEEFIIPQKIETLPLSLFYGCQSLKRVYIPEGIKHIHSSVFEKCNHLQRRE